ncbi:MAG: hypothetical protein H6682_16750 [Candidatus Eisenbacteria bacterium]|nr:hypothetical protein [Candidatus Eisenbacteria bacterium]
MPSPQSDVIDPLVIDAGAIAQSIVGYLIGMVFHDSGTSKSAAIHSSVSVRS